MVELKVFIILVNYKGWVDTIECLESLLKSNYKNFRIVIVDNNSPDSSLENLQSWALGLINPYLQVDNPLRKLVYPVQNKPIPIIIISENKLTTTIQEDTLTLIASSNNLGFAGGCNLGIKLAQHNNADYIWLLNNDTVVPKESLTHLIAEAQRLQTLNQKIGILGSKLMYYHSPNLIQAVIGEYKPVFANSRHIGMNEVDQGQYNDLIIKPNNYVVGAAMFLSRSFVEEVGLMAEDYFLYYEEIDWLNRGKRKGFGMEVCLQSIVYHKEGASIGSNNQFVNFKSELSDFYSITNKLKVTKRFYPRYLFTVYLSYFFIVYNRLKKESKSKGYH